MAEENLTLKQAVQRATETLSSENNETSDENSSEENSNSNVDEKETRSESDENKTQKTTKQAVEKKENNNENSDETSSEVEIKESPEQLQQALNLYRTLTNPTEAKNFVAQLAKDVGLEIKDTQVTAKVATKTIVEKLKESLGEENEELAVRLAPVLEDLIQTEVKKPLENNALQNQMREARTEVETVFAKLSNELPDFDKLAVEMDSIMKEIAPAKGVAMEKYLRNIYKLAGGTEKTEKTDKNSTKTSDSSSNSSDKTSSHKNKLKEIEKISKNAKETKQNVSSDVEEERTTKSLERPTAKQAVMMAVRELQGKN